MTPPPEDRHAPDLPGGDRPGADDFGADPDDDGLLGRWLRLAADAAQVTLLTAERVVARVVADSDVIADRAERLLSDTLAASARGRDDLVEVVRDEVARAISRLDAAADEGLDDLAGRGGDQDRP